MRPGSEWFPSGEVVSMTLWMRHSPRSKTCGGLTGCPQSAALQQVGGPETRRRRHPRQLVSSSARQLVASAAGPRRPLALREHGRAGAARWRSRGQERPFGRAPGARTAGGFDDQVNRIRVIGRRPRRHRCAVRPSRTCSSACHSVKAQGRPRRSSRPFRRSSTRDLVFRAEEHATGSARASTVTPKATLSSSSSLTRPAWGIASGFCCPCTTSAGAATPLGPPWRPYPRRAA